MTLAEMAQQICEKVGKLDTESLEACKGFLRLRHELIYQGALYKDSLDLYAATALKDQGTCILPIQVGRPLAVWPKGHPTALSIESMATRIMLDPSAFQQGSGGCLAFSEVSRTGWPFPLGAGSKFSFYNPPGNPQVSIGIAGWGRSATADLLDHLDSQTITIGPGATGIADWWGRVDRMTRPRTAGSILCTQVESSQTWLWPGAFDTAEFCTIALMPPPQEDTELVIYGKKAFVQMNADSDAPVIRSITNALLALGQADMLERSRQYQKASAKVSEGTALLGVVRDQDTNQSAWEARIIPVVAPLEGTEEFLGW